METRVSLMKGAPALYKATADLEKLMDDLAISAGWSKGFLHLLRLRASQINGCAFCVRMHMRDALTCDESADRIAVLPAWRETGYFSDKERAALALVESVTLIADHDRGESVYAEASAVLSPDEILAVEWLGVVINAWNRIAIAGSTPVHP